MFCLTKRRLFLPCFKLNLVELLYYFSCFCCPKCRFGSPECLRLPRTSQHEYFYKYSCWGIPQPFKLFQKKLDKNSSVAFGSLTAYVHSFHFADWNSFLCFAEEFQSATFTHSLPPFASSTTFTFRFAQVQACLLAHLPHFVIRFVKHYEPRFVASHKQSWVHLTCFTSAHSSWEAFIRCYDEHRCSMFPKGNSDTSLISTPHSVCSTAKYGQPTRFRYAQPSRLTSRDTFIQAPLVRFAHKWYFHSSHSALLAYACVSQIAEGDSQSRSATLRELFCVAKQRSSSRWLKLTCFQVNFTYVKPLSEAESLRKWQKLWTKLAGLHPIWFWFLINIGAGSPNDQNQMGFRVCPAVKSILLGLVECALRF